MKSRTFKTIVFIIITALPLYSCQKELKHMHAGDGIRFTAGSGFAQTKASYSGTTNSAGTVERIDWQAGDLMRIYCAQASEPDVHYADYRVTSVDSPESGSAVSTAHIETFSDATDGIGLRWGENDHLFYAAFPSPATTGGITTSIIANKVAANLSGSQTPASVTRSGVNCTAVADLRNMLMTAKAGPYTAETMPDENAVFLAFTPLTTAVKFTITNQSKADLTVKSVSLISASSALNGKFSVDINDVSHQPESVNLGNTTISYLQTYPYCQYKGTVSDATKKVTINFATPVTLAYDADIANCGTLTFTFFLQPCQNFDDLTFKLVKSDDSWMSTRLGYTDGTGIIFPRFKKSEVNGVFVPEGAQWTVKYGPDVVSWNAGDDDPVTPGAEVSEGATVVTSWNTGVEEEIQLQKRLFEFIDLGLPSGTKWANMNIGATAVTDYGDHYAWGELSTKTAYTLATYRWPSYEKYNGTDRLYILQAEDDIAHQQFGGRRHIPTREQFEELFNSNYTTFSWVNNYAGSGVNGYLITSKINSNYIFLPAAGLIGDSGQDLEGTNGCYWSSTLNPAPSSLTPYPSCAIDLDFSNSGTPVIYKDNDDCRRLLGESIRPVEDPKTESFLWVDLGLPSGKLWANKNIGSEIESDMGSYYAWGELTTKNSYSEANYSYKDDVSVLPAAHDIATQTYGVSCHIPSLADFTELFDTNNTTIDKSNPGYWVITSKHNGNSITLPVSGYYSGSTWRVNYSPYWTNETYTSGAKTWNLANDGEYVGLTRFYGIPVRAVKDRPNPADILPGKFSVSATKQVHFSRGNVYWDGSATPGTYKFEANQYDYRNFAGKSNDAAVINGVETTTPANTVGSFFWVKNTEVNIKPYDSSYGTPSPADAATDILFTNNTADTPNADFTVNGQTGIYRTLSDIEWGYLKEIRIVNGSHGEGYSYSINIIYCGVHGVVLYPDNYLGTPLTSGTSCTELPEGVVFLPASGFKYGNNFSGIGDIGCCLASTSNSEGSGFNMKLQISAGSFGIMGNSRSISIALRPVVDVTE